MALVMIAYFGWILLILVGIGAAFHILHLDRPRQVRVRARYEQ
jgi:hypothetical protein